MNDQPALAAVIMAAGRGRRMEGELPKVLHDFGGKPMLKWVVALARAVGAEPVIMIVGSQDAQIKAALPDENLEYVMQEKPLGTGHAVSLAAPLLDGKRGDALILSGDVPAISPASVEKLLANHRRHNAAATMLTAEVPDPSGYGRVLTDEAGHFLGVVEDKDATSEEKLLRRINSGIYVFKIPALLNSLPLIRNDNKQKEYYLPDALYILKEQSQTVAVENANDYREILGVNTKAELRKLHDEIFV
jgi:UDP-N-acetylglucosamine diphosphorylase/glucosamine-1-phosphate N-acetyltransferase